MQGGEQRGSDGGRSESRHLTDIGHRHDPAEDLAPLSNVELIAHQTPQEQREQEVELVAEDQAERCRRNRHDRARDAGEGDGEHGGIAEGHDAQERQARRLVDEPELQECSGQEPKSSQGVDHNQRLRTCDGDELARGNDLGQEPSKRNGREGDSHGHGAAPQGRAPHISTQFTAGPLVGGGSPQTLTRRVSHSRPSRHRLSFARSDLGLAGREEVPGIRFN
ncbi:unannotated protein [freshwater metagenome]|uniref:Unannotated protein n=1 Tax=freshwater metagenome TaxID=449393 RepID=A0A6J7K8E0_9ZZZZ